MARLQLKRRLLALTLGIVLMFVAGISAQHVRVNGQTFATFVNITLSGIAKFANGGSSAPSISFTNSPFDGWYWTSTGHAVYVTQGNQAVDFGTGLTLANTYLFGWASTSSPAGASGLDTNLNRASAGVINAGTTAANALGTFNGAAYQVAGLATIYRVTGDFTTANNTSLQVITGLVVPLPLNTALNVPFRCVLFYSQATAAVSDSFGAQTDTLTPTNFQVGGSMETALGVTAYGDATIANTTATAVVTGTPGSTATIFNAYLDGLIENPSGAATNLNIMVSTSAGADAITIKRGSFCRIF